MSNFHSYPQTVYEIQVQGQLDEDWQEWFNGLVVAVNYTEQRPTTTLTLLVADQAALRGILCKLWDLNLILISLRRMGAEMEEEKENE